MKELLTTLFVYSMGVGAVLFIERWDNSWTPTPWGLALKRAFLWPYYLFWE